MMLKLKFQYFSHLILTADSLEKTLMLGKTEGRRRRERQKTRWLDGIPTQWTWVWVSPGRWWRTGKPGMLQSMGSQRVRHDWEIEQQQHRTLRPSESNLSKGTVQSSCTSRVSNYQLGMNSRAWTISLSIPLPQLLMPEIPWSKIHFTFIIHKMLFQPLERYHWTL